MAGPKICLRLLTVLAGVLVCAAASLADKIVLKNGRQIVAYNVTEDGDKVRYETTAGQLSIPKSIVDHIEKGLPPVMDSPAAAAANLTMTAPPIEATANAAEIDRDYIARVEGEAHGGNARANEKAALAHHAAAQFELAHGDLEHALSDER